MRRSALKAGLAALALVVVTAAAGAAMKNYDGLVAAGQTESSPGEIARIRQFLAADKSLAKMKLARLQQRLHRAEAFRGVKGLPADVDQALQDEIARIGLEIARRQTPAGETPSPEPQLEDPPLPPYDPQ